MVLLFVFSGGILSLLLGVLVLLHSEGRRDVRYFGLLCLLAGTLVFCDTAFRIYPSLGVLQSAFAIAALLPLGVTIWVLEFLNLRQKLLKVITLSAPAIFLFFAAYVPGVIVTRVDKLLFFGYEGELGYLFGLYAFVLSSYMLFSVILLTSRYRKSAGVLKRQIKIITFGILLYAGAGLVFSLLLPKIFSIYSLTMLDAPSSIFFVAFSSYAIFRYQFFNIRVAAFELLTFLVWIFLFSNLFLSDISSSIFINSMLIVISIPGGIFLMRAIKKEVQTREKVSALAGDLISANERLRKLDQQKSEFVSIASHQLRTPITAIKGYTSMALEGSFGAVPDVVREPLDKIFVSSERLVALVEDLLTVSRIEQGRMEFHFGPVNMRTLVENMASKFNGVVKDKGLNLVVQTEDLGVYAVRGDEQKISQIVRSILENSVKFTEHGYIRILLSHDRMAGKVRVAFSDTGIGMDSIIVGSLFKKLEVTGKDHRRKTGQGLGLYIADQVIRAHGGSIWAESQGMGKGTTFFIEFPAWNATAHTHILEEGAPTHALVAT